MKCKTSFVSIKKQRNIINWQRGASFSTLTVVLIPVLLFSAGLAVDGSRQAAGNRHAEAVAAGAARSGLDASAGLQVYEYSSSHVAINAAEQWLSQHSDLTSTVTINPEGQLTVETSGHVDTIFLAIGGVNQLPVSGSATVDIVATEN